MEIHKTGAAYIQGKEPRATAPRETAQSPALPADSVEITGTKPAAGFIRSVKGKAKEYDAPRARPDMSDIKGLSVGTALYLGYELGGIGTFIHESAHKAMVEAFYKNSNVTIQIDSFDNVKNFIDKPSGQNFVRMFTMFDANQDKAAGVTRYTYGDGLTETGQKYTDNQRQAIISAAGSLSTEIPALAGFAVGFKLRKSHPAIGYTMMAMSGMMHITNSAYVIDAVLPGQKQPGHDWAKFAQATGVPAALTAAVFALSMPAIGVGMYLLEKHAAEKKKDVEALNVLIADNEIPQERLNEIMKGYGRREQIDALEGKMADLLDRPVGSVDEKFKKEIRKTSRELTGEYEKFSHHLVKHFRSEIDEYRKTESSRTSRSPGRALKAMARDIKDSYEADKTGTALKGAGLAGGVAVAGKGMLQAAEALAPGAAPVATGVAAKALSAVIPGLGLLGAAGTAYQAGKALKNPNVGKIDKTAAVSQAVFSAVGAASLMIPGLGLPLALVSLGGMAATLAGRWIAHKIAD